MAGQMYAAGWEVAGAIMGLGLLGYGIDYFVFGSVTPRWFTIGGMLLGLVGGLYNASKRAFAVLGQQQPTGGAVGSRSKAATPTADAPSTRGTPPEANERPPRDRSDPGV